jgi:hypothetical protein
VEGDRELQNGLKEAGWFFGEIVDYSVGLVTIVETKSGEAARVKAYQDFMSGFNDEMLEKLDMQPDYYASTLEKIGGVAGNIMVAPLENGRILLAMGGGAKEYVQVEENLFREADPSVSIRAGLSPEYLAFQQDTEGHVTGFVIDGLPFMSLRKLPVHATSQFNVNLLVFCLAIFIAVLLRRFFQRRQLKAYRPRDRAAIRAAVLTAVTNLLALAGVGLTLLLYADVLGGEIPLFLKITLVFPILAVGAGLYLALQCRAVWKHGLLENRWARVRYTLITLCGLFMIWFYWFWNVLGWQYME